MTIPLPIEPIHDTGTNGQLVACGASWSEINAARIAYAFFALGVAFLFGYAFVGDVLDGRIRMKPHDVVLAVIIASTIAFAGRIIICGVCKRRSIIFYLDGTIGTPQGFCANERLSEMMHECADIVSIEAAFNKECQWEVLVYLQDGHVFTWTQFLSKYDAHLVAVTLTGALRDIRRAAAHRPGLSGSTSAGTRRDEAAYIVID